MIHGNVSTLYQDNRKMALSNSALASERIKEIDYGYDLISGNVHRVSVQDTKADEWHHSYLYDADNRIVEAYSLSRTPLLGARSLASGLQNEVIANTDWQNDARYFYYLHGPLGRAELGQHQVQGLDYVYNLQGWLKGVNSTTLNSNRDPGEDGKATGVNHAFAADVFGYALDYFAGDYHPVNSNKAQPLNAFAAGIAGSDLDGMSLYNGNIRSMQLTITDPVSRQVLPLGNKYQYDQLQRLKESRSFVSIDLNTNMWQHNGYHKEYYNAFTYDANGNIETQKRHDQSGTAIENLTYQYHDELGERIRNRLYHVNETVNPSVSTSDIDDQGTFYPTGTANQGINGANGRVSK